MAKHGKKFCAAAEKVTGNSYNIDEAIQLVKQLSYVKFDETIEIAAKLNLKKSHSVRDTVVLPNQFRTEARVLVFAQGDKAKEAQEAGATYVGGADLVQKIQGGWLDFDVCVATPDMMKDVGKLGQILGRRGMMPNPKTRTVTMDVKGALAELKQGRTEFRADKGGVVHLAIGKVKSMDDGKIRENLLILLEGLQAKRPADVKGDYIRTLSIASTMGPGVRVDLSSVVV
ncbi:50S ribosomal protein L1 [Candidatus Haliotispira prima]|uniref:Large ribosomal subunit protein uL1 n=1 Tax=Candidatus Haliotispira prima TaxID=3034016 RepID=A0ABY8MHE0_9SPIO|nr:50S ribosomal protein L1 [Candidatus Haliotispira prima]